MNWIYDDETQVYTSELGVCRARVWNTESGKWSARVIAPRKEQWAHSFITSDEAKAWCEEQLHELSRQHRCAG